MLMGVISPCVARRPGCQEAACRRFAFRCPPGPAQGTQELSIDTTLQAGRAQCACSGYRVCIWLDCGATDIVEPIRRRRSADCIEEMSSALSQADRCPAASHISAHLLVVLVVPLARVVDGLVRRLADRLHLIAQIHLQAGR